jgi:HlyD family secretion protein
LFAIGLIVVLFLSPALFFHKGKSAITVQTEKITRHNITETVVANGKVYPVLQVHISPEVSGEITELAVKEGQVVKKGDLLLKIKPDLYIAAVNQAKANYESSIAAKTTAVANLEKADTDYDRNKELFARKLISESDYIGFKVARDVAKANVESAVDQVDVAKAAVDSAQDALDKTTIFSPMDGTISKLNSQLGERVLGTVQNAGTDIMVISDLTRMEARVDIGEMDIVLLQPGQKAQLEVDSFKEKKFTGIVTDVASSSEGMNSAASALGGGSSSSSGGTATQFEVRIRVQEADAFRPGMSVSATIETRSRTNVLAAPIASVTTRALKDKSPANGKGTNSPAGNASGTNSMAANSPATNSLSTNVLAGVGGTTNQVKDGKKSGDAVKPTDVVFVVEGDHVKTAPVKIGISDDNFYEITEGLKEGDEIVTGGYRAISRDLDDGKKIIKGAGVPDMEKPKS